MLLFHELSPHFDISPCTFFCSTLFPALCKKITIDHSVKYTFKKKCNTNRVPRVSIIIRHMTH